MKQDLVKTIVNQDLVKTLVEQCGGTYTLQNVFTTKHNGLPIEMMERFARLVVLECARADSEANNEDHVEGESYNWGILDHFGVKP